MIKKTAARAMMNVRTKLNKARRASRWAVARWIVGSGVMVGENWFPKSSVGGARLPASRQYREILHVQWLARTLAPPYETSSKQSDIPFMPSLKQNFRSQ